MWSVIVDEIIIENSINSIFCFQIFTNSSGMSWDDCQQQCENNGANMTSIHSAVENEFIHGIIIIICKKCGL